MRTAFVRSRCRSSPRGPRSCLGAGLRALMRGGAYKVRQIWCSRYFLLHSQAWAGSPFRKSIASRQYLGFWRQDIARPPGWKSTSVSGAFRRAARNRHRHAIEQASRR